MDKQRKELKGLTEEETIALLRHASRSELFENKRVFRKGVQATLYALGFEHDWCYSMNEYEGRGLLECFDKVEGYY